MSSNMQLSLSEEKDALPLAFKNHLLAQLLRNFELRDSIRPHLKIISLELNQVLYQHGDTIETVYFPISSVVSRLAIMEDGVTIETSMVGPEGTAGISAILGGGKARQWLWVLVAGAAIQLPAKLLDKLLLHHEDALKDLLRFYRSLMTQTAQRCVCNTRHTVLDRLCCWLLMLQDRVPGGNLHLTQELIASRLGARRAGITVAAGMLQDMKAIEYRRGQLHITDREVLERAACECYPIMRSDFRFTPPRDEIFGIQHRDVRRKAFEQLREL